MKEGKVFIVSPRDEQFTIDAKQKFGWEIVGAQEVFSQVSYLKQSSNDTISSVTNKTNFVRLLFKRDTKMPHYKEIKALEDEFDSISYPPMKKVSGGLKFFRGLFIIVGLILAVLSFVIGARTSGSSAGIANTGMLIGGAVSFVFGLILGGVCSSQEKKYQAEFEAGRNKVIQRKTEILKKVETYVD